MPGGVLSDGEIWRRSDGVRRPLISDCDPECLRPAAYDVAIAADDLTTPEGREHKVGDPVDSALLLDPGKTAELTSHECVDLPDCIAGTLSIKTHLARRGLLLLTGNVIDPGYRGRLHFYVANVGAQTIALEPGSSRIAVVQFQHVCGPKHDGRKSTISTPSRAGNLSLGFLRDLGNLNERFSALERDVHRHRTLSEQILLLGYFVLAVTLLGISLDHLISIGSSDKLVADLQRAIPNSVGGKTLMGVLALSLAWTVASLAAFVPTTRTPPFDESREPAVYRREALRQLRRQRAARYIAAGWVLVPLVTSFARLLTALHWSGEGWIAPPIAAGLLAAFAWLMLHWVQPITASAVSKRATELAREESSDEPPTPASDGAAAAGAGPTSGPTAGAGG